MAMVEDTVDLKIGGVIGFSGNVPNGLKYTPCGNYMIYPLGSQIIVKNTVTNNQTFLEGHSSDVSCIAMSSDGRTLASGKKKI
mmetsp:Transcript_29704/g.34974  ORF Transcript_29704/g.34974 Transcript_29704/m.34974 type:complete len:83 (+) Transcript_29704:78-326(+)